MNPPPAYQIQGLLEYLWHTLRADSELLSATGGTADEILAGILDIEPTVRGEQAIYMQESPLLCAREESTEVIHGGHGRGFRGAVSLWYAVQHPVADTVSGIYSLTTSDLPVAPPAAADRLARAVWWRIAHYLHVMEATVGAGPISLADAQIYSVQPTGRITYVHRDGWLLSRMPLTMDYYLPPYQASAPTVLDGVDVTIYDQTGDPDPFTDGIPVGTEYDVPT